MSELDRIFGRPAFAIAFGAFVLCGETCNHIESILRPAHWWELPIYDWAAGGFLVAAGVIAGRDATRGRLYQAAAWGCMVSLLAGAFFAHWEEWAVEPHSDGWISTGGFLAIIGMLLAAGICALASTLRSQPSRRNTDAS